MVESVQISMYIEKAGALLYINENGSLENKCVVDISVNHYKHQ
jgi:hypothetical protein